MALNRTSLSALLFGLMTCSSTAAWAKSDEQLWTTANVNVKLTDALRLQQEVTTRFSDSRNGVYEVESVTMLGYRVGKNLTLAAGYVHNPQYADGDFTVMEHRAREQISVDNFAKFGSGKLSARMRLEQRWREGVDGTGWRARPYVKYSLPIRGKTALNITNEIFLNLNTTSFQRHSGLDRMRNLISVSTPVTKTLNGEAGYMNQHGFVRGGEDTTDHAAYLALSLSL